MINAILAEVSSSPQATTSFTIAGLSIAGLMAALAMVRGVFKIFKGMITLGLGFAAGTWVFVKGPEFIKAAGMTDGPSFNLLAGLSVVAGAIGHLGSNFFAGKLLSGMDLAQSAATGFSKGKAALLSLIPSSATLWAGGILVRLFGSVSGVQQADQGAQNQAPSLVSQWSEKLNSGWLGKVFEATDPVTDDRAVKLAEILVVYRDTARWSDLKKNPRLSPFLANKQLQPIIDRLLNDKEVIRAIGYQDYASLIRLPEVKAAIADATMRQALDSMPAMPVRRAERVK